MSGMFSFFLMSVFFGIFDILKWNAHESGSCRNSDSVQFKEATFSLLCCQRFTSLSFGRLYTFAQFSNGCD